MKDKVQKLFQDYPYKKFHIKKQNLDTQSLSSFFSERFFKKDFHFVSNKDLIVSMEKLNSFSKTMGFDVFLMGDLLKSKDVTSYCEAIDQAKEYAISKGDNSCVIVVKEPVNNVSCIRDLIEHGFYYVCMEAIYVLNISKSLPNSKERFSLVRKAENKDIQRVKILSQHAHKDIRYYCDPYFNRKKVTDFYQSTASDGVKKDNQEIFIYEEDGEISGFITVILNQSLSNHLNEGYGSLDYISVDPKKQCLGIGYILNNYALDYLKNNHIHYISVKTMGSNYQAMSLLSKNGFVLTSQNMVLHWRKNRLSN